MATKKSNKVDNAVTKYIKGFDKKLAMQVKDIHIPSFMVLQKNITTQSFFMDHIEYEAIMGDAVKLLDRMMLNIISEFITDQILDSMKNEYYIGVWDRYTVYSVAAATVTFMKHDSKPITYLTEKQFVTISEEDLAKLPEGSYMPFGEYNPTRLMQMINRIKNLVTVTMSNIMVRGVPNTFISPDGTSSGQSKFIFDRFFDLVKNADLDLKIKPNDPIAEKNILMFSDTFEKPILTYLSNELNQAGLSSNVINLFLGTCDFKVIYDVPEKEVMNNLVYEYRMVSKDERFETPVIAAVTFEAKDLFAIYNADKREDIAASRATKIGNLLRKAILTYTEGVISLYVSTVAANKAN